MANILTDSSAYQGTFTVGTVVVDPHFQVCAVADINASNQLECTFWLNIGGLRADTNLGSASYRLRDKTGALVSGVSQTGITPDVNGYYHTTAVSAALIYDLSHYVLEIEVPYDGVEKAASIGLVRGE